MPTCEGCNRTDRAMMTNELCSDCSDKAARFDIVLIERNQLLTAVKDALKDLEQANGIKRRKIVECMKGGGKPCLFMSTKIETNLKDTFLSQALGRLMVAKNYCES